MSLNLNFLQSNRNFRVGMWKLLKNGNNELLEIIISDCTCAVEENLVTCFAMLLPEKETFGKSDSTGNVS